MKGPLFGCVIFHTSENHVPEGMNPTAFIHVGRKRDQAETDGSVELSRIYIYGKYTADSGTGCGR